MQDPPIIFSSVTQVQVFLAVFIPAMSVILAGAIAWGSNKYATIAHEKLIGEIQKSIKELEETTKLSFERLREDVSQKVPFADCNMERKECSQARMIFNGEISKQISLLVTALTVQDEKREGIKDKNHEMFCKILDKISAVESKVASMEGFVQSRANKFRPPLAEDLNA